jgi:hypothetical protein
VVTLSQFDEAQLPVLQRFGVVRRVDTMTLEEIFVQSVMHNRRGAAV